MKYYIPTTPIIFTHERKKKPMSYMMGSMELLCLNFEVFYIIFRIKQVTWLALILVVVVVSSLLIYKLISDYIIILFHI